MRRLIIDLAISLVALLERFVKYSVIPNILITPAMKYRELAFDMHTRAENS